MSVERTLSIIIPAYNEEATILTILQRVNSVIVPGVKKEVIVIDDGSKDKTAEIVRNHPELHSKFIALTKNGGKGAAVIAGLKNATGEFILFQDADLEYDPADYPKLLHVLCNYRADVVLGSRVLAPQIIRVHYGLNKWGNKILTGFFNLMYNKTFTDIYTCYLAFRRQLVNPDSLKTFGFEQQAEILGQCVNNGKIFYEVAISYHGRDFAEGKKIKARHAIAVLWTIFKCRLFQQKARVVAPVEIWTGATIG